MYYVYLLRCRDGSLYTGTAADLARRIREHATGSPRSARYVRSRGAAGVAAAWRMETRGQALRLEARIKRLTRAEKLTLAARPEQAETLCAMPSGSCVPLTELPWPKPDQTECEKSE